MHAVNLVPTAYFPDVEVHSQVFPVWAQGYGRYWERLIFFVPSNARNFSATGHFPDPGGVITVCRCYELSISAKNDRFKTIRNRDSYARIPLGHAHDFSTGGDIPYPGNVV